MRTATLALGGGPMVGQAFLPARADRNVCATFRFTRFSITSRQLAGVSNIIPCAPGYGEATEEPCLPSVHASSAKTSSRPRSR